MILQLTTPAPTLRPQIPHLLHHRRWSRLVTSGK